MKKIIANKRIPIITALVLALALALTGGCQAAQQGGGELTDIDAPQRTADGADANEAAAAVVAVPQNVVNEDGSIIPAQQITLESMKNVEFSARDMEVGYEQSTATYIALNTTDISVTGGGAVVNGSMVTINSAGTFVLSGSLADGSVVVDADGQKVHIVLDGAAVKSSTGAALYIKAADKVFLTLAKDSANSMEDGEQYAAGSDEAGIDAAIYSKADLTINGGGSLDVKGNYKNGIVSKDELAITGGNINVTAVANGVCGKDSVKLANGVLTVDAGEDGVKSNNSEDADRGYVYIKDGTLTVTAGNDGIQAETLLQIDGGDIRLTTGGGSANASIKADGGFAPNWGNWGRGGKAVAETAAADTATTEAATAEADAAEDVSTSAKGLKAAGCVSVTGGNITVDSSDDCIHSNGYVGVSGGTLALSSGDDGIHADSAVSVTGGETSILKSYEGVEAAMIYIGGGELTLNASDDGFNGAGGNDGSAVNGRPGQGGFDVSDGSQVHIAGGYVFIDASGDGLDSNGDLFMKGGTVIVNGPTNGGNGALDYAGTGLVTGGTLIAAGASGMAQGIDGSETQGSITYAFSESQQANTRVTLTDESGAVLISYAPTKSFQTVNMSVAGIVSGGSYTVSTGGTVNGADAHGLALGGSLEGGEAVETITMESATYSNGGSFMGGPAGGGPMAGRPDGERPVASGTSIPDGNPADGNPADGNPPDMPQGGTPPDGAPPDMPQGGTPPDGAPPDMPQGGTPPTGAPPDMPQG